MRRGFALAAVSTLCWFAMAGAALSDTAAFDLIGPKVEVRVEREGKTLPISEVPS